MALFGGDSTSLTKKVTNIEEKAIQAENTSAPIVQAQGDVTITGGQGIVDSALDFLGDALEIQRDQFSQVLGEVGDTTATIAAASRGEQAQSFDKFVQVMAFAAVAAVALFVFGSRKRA